ncbi:MAG: NADH-quinone oxidoreductase subunit K [Myxococcota bacterium]|nr:NADH-quinone oxidoreductase subunit K [Myxococcota bacterium]
MTLLLTLLVGLLFTLGIYLLMARTPARLIIGLMLLGNGANLGVFVAGGLTAGQPPLTAAAQQAPAAGAADPVPQALVLTAIVIGFAVTALAAGLIWRTQADHPDNDLDAMNRSES